MKFPFNKKERNNPLLCKEFDRELLDNWREQISNLVREVHASRVDLIGREAFIKNFRMSPHTYKWLTNPQNQENSKSLALSALFRFARQAKQEGFKDAIKRLQQALGSNCSEETLDALFPLSAKFELSTNTLMLEDPIQMRMTVVIQRLSNAINQSISPSTLLRKLERFADEIEDED